LTLRIGINGFGRIGRAYLRALLKKKLNHEIVAINDITDAKTLAHLFKYDSTYGRLESEVAAKDSALVIDGHVIPILAQKDPAQLPWRDSRIDLALESTGLFTDREQAAKHLTAGAKRVLISAPAKKPDITIVPGVNHHQYDPAKHLILSLASCTTNCVTPVAKVLHETAGIKHGFMTTVHAYTNDQRVLDLPHKDLRRARSAAVSIIPTSTGAAVATTEVMPELKGKLHGIALRVPVPDGSIVDLVAEVEKEITADMINDAYRKASDGYLKGILTYSEEPLVSVDIIGDPHSAIVDGLSTMVLDRNLVKVLAWYDNEWGYANRLVDMTNIIAQKS